MRANSDPRRLRNFESTPAARFVRPLPQSFPPGPKAPRALLTTAVSHRVTGRAYVAFPAKGTVSGLPRVSITRHSSPVENDVISPFPLVQLLLLRPFWAFPCIQSGE